MWDWTEADIITAQRCRLARLMQVIPELQQTIVLLDLEYVLQIHSNDVQVIPGLLSRLKQIQQEVYIVLGCSEIKLWSGHELIAYESLGLQSTVDTRNDHEGSIMVTTTTDRSTVPALNSSTKVDILPGQTISAIAEDTEQPIESIRAWIQEQNWPIIPFNGEEVIAGDVAIAAIDHFTLILIQQRKAKRGLQTSPAAELNGAFDPKALVTESIQTAPAVFRMNLPRGYSNKLAKNNRANLVRALPQKPQLRLQYLEQIVSGTAQGKEFLSKIADATIKKYGGDKVKVSDSLLEIAKTIQAETLKMA